MVHFGKEEKEVRKLLLLLENTQHIGIIITDTNFNQTLSISYKLVYAVPNIDKTNCAALIVLFYRSTFDYNIL